MKKDTESSKEVWKPIPNYEDKYAISSKGVVKSIARKALGRNGCMRSINEKIVSSCKTEYGVEYVTLYSNNRRKHFRTLDLMQMAFEGKESEHIINAKPSTFSKYKKPKATANKVPVVSWDSLAIF